MKTIPKIINLLLIILLIGASTACKDHKASKINSTAPINKLEDDKSFAGSSKREDICNFFDKEDVRLAFDVSDEIEIEQKESKSTICSYDWIANRETMLVYSLSLNFARGEKRSNGQIDAVWKSQNTGVYSKHNLQKVSGLGDKASWSDLGGGQLRVAANGYIFYVSLMALPSKNNPLSKKDMIDKTSVLAKQVIKRM